MMSDAVKGSREWTVARVADIAEPGALAFTTGEGDWPFRGVVVRWQGAVHAYENSCPHQRHPLNLTPEGFFTPDRQALICASHGATFEPDTGACSGGPCAGQALRRLECRVDDGNIVVVAPASMR